MRTISLLVVSSAVSFMACACSSAPMVPIAPEVRVSQLDPLLITPDSIRFQARVVIDNQMRGDLNVEKVDWAADLHDKPIVEETFDRLKPMRSRGRQTVTLPFQIPMSDVVNQAVDVLAEESVRVDFRGSVFPVGFDPVPFKATRTIPIPKIPVVTIGGAEGNPLQGQFTVYLDVENTNDFPMGIESVDTHLELNGKRYELLRNENAGDIAPSAKGRIALTMKQTRGKGLSMALNVIQSQGSTDFTIGGSIRCPTPHGVIFVPVELRSK